jgi:hypothetical protein
MSRRKSENFIEKNEGRETHPVSLKCVTRYVRIGIKN